MAIAYFLMAHDNVAQLARLLRAIDDPRNHVLIHVDAKSPPGFHRDVTDLVADFANMRVMAPRRVRWASYSVVDTTLAGMRELLANDPHWHHFWNLSGQDFPLQTQAALIDHLQANRTSSFLQVFDPQTQWVDAQTRIRRLRLEIPGLQNAVMIPRLRIDRWRRHLGDRKYWGGSSYFTMSRALCEDLLSSPELPAYRRFFKFSYTTDEIFIPTFVMNSQWRDTVIHDNLRLIDFSEGTPRPRTWTDAHRTQVMTSPAYFARKFDTRVDEVIIERLEQRLADLRR